MRLPIWLAQTGSQWILQLRHAHAIGGIWWGSPADMLWQPSQMQEVIQLILCIHVTGDLHMRGLIGMAYLLLMANSCGQQLKMSMLTHPYSRGHQEGPGNLEEEIGRAS